MIPWCEKYRPKQHEQLFETSKVAWNAVDAWWRSTSNFLILHGPPGSGKTTAVGMLERSIGECREDADEDYNVLHVNMAEESDPSEFCQKLTIWSSSSGPVGFNKVGKLLISDEADDASFLVQMALCDVLDRYGNAFRLIFLCNNLDLLSDRLRHRADIVFVPAMESDTLKHLVRTLLVKEWLITDEQKLEPLSHQMGSYFHWCSDPIDARFALNTMQIVHALKLEPTVESLQKVIGIPTEQQCKQVFVTPNVILQGDFQLFEWVNALLTLCKRECRFDSLFEYLLVLRKRLRSTNVGNPDAFVIGALMRQIVK